jgi:hypothetical protein
MASRVFDKVKDNKMGVHKECEAMNVVLMMSLKLSEMTEAEFKAVRNKMIKLKSQEKDDHI